MTSLRITLADARDAGYCMRGCRAWATHHGLSWSAFVNEGLPIEVFEKLDDGLGNVLVAAVRARQPR